MCAQNGTMHLWYSRSHQPCQWLSESGVCWAPGGSLMYQTSDDNGTVWSNATVRAAAVISRM